MSHRFYPKGHKKPEFGKKKPTGKWEITETKYQGKKENVKPMSLKEIGKNWDITHIYTKVFLANDTEFESFKGKIIIKSGFYFISGFWANVVGLSTTHKNALETKTEYHIKSVNLKIFQVENKLE